MKLSDTKLEDRSCPPHGSQMNPELCVVCPLECLFSDIRAQRLQVATLEVPIEKRLRSIYQCDD